MGNKIKLSDEQELAVRLMLSGVNVFLSGEAGTGKSIVLKEFKKRTDKETVYLAPTGVAAINIGGATIEPNIVKYQSDYQILISEIVW